MKQLTLKIADNNINCKTHSILKNEFNIIVVFSVSLSDSKPTTLKRYIRQIEIYEVGTLIK